MPPDPPPGGRRKLRPAVFPCGSVCACRNSRSGEPDYFVHIAGNDNDKTAGAFLWPAALVRTQAHLSPDKFVFQACVADVQHHIDPMIEGTD